MKYEFEIAPAHVVAANRVRELAEAIAHRIQDGDIRHCKMWNEEMMTQLALIEHYKPIEIWGLEKQTENPDQELTGIREEASDAKQIGGVPSRKKMR